MSALLDVGVGALALLLFMLPVAEWMQKYVGGIAAFSMVLSAVLTFCAGVFLVQLFQPKQPQVPPSQLGNLAELAAGVALAWQWATPIGKALGPHAPRMLVSPYWLGLVVAYLMGSLGVAVMIALLRRRSSGASISSGWSLILRPVKGYFADCAVGALLIVSFYPIAAVLFLKVYLFLQGVDSLNNHMRDLLGILIAYSVIIALFVKWPQTLRFIAVCLRWPRRILRLARFGKGGSGSFAGMVSEWESYYSRGDILLGSSSYDSKRKIGLKDDRHLLTIAATGGGKGRSAIIPNLLLWPHSAIVIDPKGTNAAVTAHARGHGGGRVTKSLGQDVYVLDPFEELMKQGVNIASAHFNPLADLDPNSPNIFEDIMALTDGIVMPNPKAEPHWDKKARGIIAGMIAQVITSEPPQDRTLVKVRDNLMSTDPDSFKALVDDMMLNPLAAGLAREAALDIMRSGDSNEMRSVLSNIQNNLLWLLSPPMRKILSRSDFSMRDIKRKPTTLYLVLPLGELEEHARFLRLFVSAGLRTLMQREKGKSRGQKVLFLLDEFLALGRMNAVLQAINVGRSFGIKLWPIAQNVNGLADLYGENWQTFVDGAGAVQVFSIGNRVSAEFLASALGHHHAAMTGDPNVRQLVPVRTGQEIQEETDRDWEKQVVLRSGKQAFYLNRMPYDRYFKKHQYAPDPDHPDRNLFRKLLDLIFRLFKRMGAAS